MKKFVLFLALFCLTAGELLAEEKHDHRKFGVFAGFSDQFDEDQEEDSDDAITHEEMKEGGKQDSSSSHPGSISHNAGGA